MGRHSNPNYDRARCRLSSREKERLAFNQLRPPALRCPQCCIEVTSQDLLTHQAQRCSGPTEPHPREPWIRATEAASMGVRRETLWRWMRRGLVRFQGERNNRVYLMRDVTWELALRRRRR